MMCQSVWLFELQSKDTNGVAALPGHILFFQADGACCNLLHVLRVKALTFGWSKFQNLKDVEGQCGCNFTFRMPSEQPVSIVFFLSPQAGLFGLMATARILDTGLYQLQTGQFQIFKHLNLQIYISWLINDCKLIDFCQHWAKGLHIKVLFFVFPGHHFDLCNPVWPLASGWGYLQLRGDGEGEAMQAMHLIFDPLNCEVQRLWKDMHQWISVWFWFFDSSACRPFCKRWCLAWRRTSLKNRLLGNLLTWWTRLRYLELQYL